jgi:hypothetical protein
MDPGINGTNHCAAPRIRGWKMGTWKIWESPVTPDDAVFNVRQTEPLVIDEISSFLEKGQNTQPGFRHTGFYTFLNDGINDQRVVKVDPKRQALVPG